MKHVNSESWKRKYLRSVSNNIHPEFLEALDQIAGKRLCKLVVKDAVGLIATARFNALKAKCDVYKIRESAFEARLNRSYPSCLPENKEEFPTPQDCPCVERPMKPHIRC